MNRRRLPGTTDDRFVLVISESDAGFDVAAATQLLEEFHVLQLEERIGVAGEYR